MEKEGRWTYESDGSFAGNGTRGVKEGWSYHNFGGGEPNDWGNNEDCIELVRGSYLWNDNVFIRNVIR